LQDVTDDPAGLSVAFDIVVEGYSALSSMKLDHQQVLKTVCFDDYHRSGLARTLLLIGDNPENGRVEPLGTFRITLGSADSGELGLPPLEAMRLMTYPEGWENFHFEGFEVNQVVEGGRAAVSPVCRTETGRAIGLASLVLRALVEGAFRIAWHTYGRSQLWGVLPCYMVKRLESFGMRVIPAPRVSPRYQENARLFKEYERYWLHSNPSFYKVVVNV
jgi:hypothetical protein